MMHQHGLGVILGMSVYNVRSDAACMVCVSGVGGVNVYILVLSKRLKVCRYLALHV